MRSEVHELPESIHKMAFAGFFLVFLKKKSVAFITGLEESINPSRIKNS